ncbi:MAG: GntR family transcriptional regulator [Synergistaceae bacterium]|jgi:DNA-binding GntR family transcriptional regulator|nr:GntR family transcriptional regulator [Synergistaceae bacterium]
MERKIFSPANTPNLREVVYERIKEAIVSGVIPAGSKLSEISLSNQFDVSRTPVREAIRQLVETGLVSLTPRKGAYVLLPTTKDVTDLYEIRTALELIAIDHICANPPKRELTRMRESFEAVSNDWDALKFMAMDEEFHSNMSKNARNNFLDFMLEKVGAIIGICRHYAIDAIPKVSSSLEHIAIIDAILARDTDAAREKMKLHLANTRDGLLAYISRHPEVSRHETNDLTYSHD